jgi:hypothetical protein
MNTKHIKDRAERKKAKRSARKEAPAYTGREKNEARGSLKKKVKKIVKGQRKR